MRSRGRRRAFVVLIGLLAATAIALLSVPTLGVGHATATAPSPSRAHPGVRRHPTAGTTPGTRTTPIARTTPTSGPHRADPVGRLMRLGLPIFCGGGSEKLVALPFDDGPGVLSHEAWASLKAHHDTATFFLVGKLLGAPWLSGVLRQEIRFGAAFGDHTWDHVTMTGRSTAFMGQQIERTRNAIRAKTHRAVFLFRPPLGLHDPQLDRYVRSRGMLQIIWSIDTGDSQGASAAKIVRAVKQNLSPGDIILMHDNRSTTERALPRIVHVIDQRGYTTVTVPQLLTQDPPSTRQVRQQTCS
jgi:peptidoglycan/xylan/chitin deacetylase (PgdA/CDA1 family)